MVNVRVGQMWAWTLFTVGDGSWFVTYVSDEARTSSVARSVGLIRKGATFTVVALDDDGPATIPTFDELAAVGHRNVWHVVLLDDRLCWFESGWFDFCELLRDVA